MAAAKRLPKLIDALAARYEADGKKVELTDLRDPFQLGAWYILGQHAKRNGQARAFDALRRAKGVTPGQLLDIPEEKLATIAQTAGPYEDARAKELYAYADRIEEKCGQDLSKVFKSQAEARKFVDVELRKPRAFADFLLLYGGEFPIFPVDLRIARVATRLGYGRMKSEKELDDKSYTDIQKALLAECPKDPETMIRFHSALYRHANDTCHAGAPACDQCPLAKECPYAKKHPVQPKVLVNPPPGASFPLKTENAAKKQ